MCCAIYLSVYKWSLSLPIWSVVPLHLVGAVEPVTVWIVTSIFICSGPNYWKDLEGKPLGGNYVQIGSWGDFMIKLMPQKETRDTYCFLSLSLSSSPSSSLQSYWLFHSNKVPASYEPECNHDVILLSFKHQNWMTINIYAYRKPLCVCRLW